VAAEAFRRLVCAQLGPAAAAAAAAAAARAVGSAADGAAAAGPGAASPFGAAGAARGDGDDGEDGIAVGSPHQADLPQLRPLPAVGAAIALMELRKAGARGPALGDALAEAIQEKARSDLLPKDAVEDVWARGGGGGGGGLALERSQRQRKPPGWQAGYVDPLKPMQQQQQQPHANGAAGEGGGGSQADAQQQESARRRAGSGAQQQADDGRRLRAGGPAHQLRGGSGGGAVARLRNGGMDGVGGTGSPRCGQPSGSPLSYGPRVPPSGFWLAPNVPVYAAPIGPELLSWQLVVPQRAPAVAAPPAAAAVAGSTPAPAAAAAAASEPPSQQEQAAEPSPEPLPAAKRAKQEPPQDAAGGACAAVALQQQPAAADAAGPEAMQTDDAPAAQGTSAAAPGQPPAQQAQAREQQQQQPQAAAAPSQPSAAGDAVASAPAAALPVLPPAAAAPAAADAPEGVPAQQAHGPATSPAAGTLISAASGGPAPAGVLQAEQQQLAPGLVQMRIVLDGCVFVGHLAEAGRLDMTRSRVGAAVEPVKQVRVGVARRVWLLGRGLHGVVLRQPTGGRTRTACTPALAARTADGGARAAARRHHVRAVPCARGAGRAPGPGARAAQLRPELPRPGPADAGVPASCCARRRPWQRGRQPGHAQRGATTHGCGSSIGGSSSTSTPCGRCSCAGCWGRAPGPAGGAGRGSGGGRGG
jgi:hypothetical protein